MITLCEHLHPPMFLFAHLGQNAKQVMSGWTWTRQQSDNLRTTVVQISISISPGGGKHSKAATS